MMVVRFLGLFAMACSVALLSIGAAQANRLDPYWQSEREFFNALSDRACEGDMAAMEDLVVAAWHDENAVALHNLAWHYINSDSCPVPSISYDAEIIVEAQRLSAELGYPLGQYGAGMMALEGQHGVWQDQTRGVIHLLDAMEGGVSSAAEQLALIYAEGRGEYDPDPAFAAQLVQTAAELGLPLDRLRTLTERVAAVSQIAEEPSRPSEGRPQPSESITQQSSTQQPGAGGIVQVLVSGGANVPQLGDRLDAGNWTDVVVYVAQAFEWNGRCWSASTLEMVGSVRVDTNPGAQGTLQSLLELSDMHRAAGENGALVQNFRSLDEGVQFIIDNPWHRISGTGEPFSWSLAEVEALGSRCPAGEDIHYPVPVRDEAF